MADAATKDAPAKEMTEEERMAAEWAAMADDGDGTDTNTGAGDGGSGQSTRVLNQNEIELICEEVDRLVIVTHNEGHVYDLPFHNVA